MGVFQDLVLPPDLLTCNELTANLPQTWPLQWAPVQALQTRKTGKFSLLPALRFSAQLALPQLVVLFLIVAVTLVCGLAVSAALLELVVDNLPMVWQMLLSTSTLL